MSWNLLTKWDFSTADAALQTIRCAMLSKHGFGAYRPDLVKARDELHELAVEFERNGAAEEFDEGYLLLFDALSHLTAALRGRAINATRLYDCRSTLERLMQKAVGQ